MATMTSEVPDTMLEAVTRAAEHYRVKARMALYRNDPALWAKERLGITLWSKQAAIALSVVKNKRTAVKSGHGIGKSYLAAVLIMWWIDTHQDDIREVQVITTAPTWSMVRGIVWEYVRAMHKDHGFLGSINEQAEWRDDERFIRAFGTKPADSSSTGFSGRHYDYTLVLIDEASGVPEILFTSAGTVTTVDTCRILAIGNPIDPNTFFGSLFLSNGGNGLPGWAKYTISTMDTPVFTGEEAPAKMLKSLTSKSQVDDWRDQWGADSNDFKARVLGEFPETTEDSMFPLHLIYRGINLSLDPMALRGIRPVLGVDISRFGTDKSTVISNTGGLIIIEDIWTDKGEGINDSIYAAQKVHDIAVRTHAREVRVDSIGPGSGVVDQLRVLCLNHDYVVMGMRGDGASTDNTKYLNARAEWHAQLRDKLAASEISLPDVTKDGEEGQEKDHDGTQLFEEMRQIKKKYAKNMTLQIESKEDMRKRGVHSPDISDAVVYATAKVDVTAMGPAAKYDVGETFSTPAYEMAGFTEYDLGAIISPF